jgi:RHS repeat-associated protein
MRRRAGFAVALALLPALAAAQQVEYYHLDALGSIRAVTDANREILVRHDYEPFGEEWNEPESTDSRRFTGKERDFESGWDYFGARYSSAPVARFTTVDPVYAWSENLADPERWNRYAYVRNNPLRFADPDGREIAEIPLGNGQYLNLISGQVHPVTPLTTTELKLIGVVLNTTNFGDMVEYAYESSPDRSPLLLRAKDSLSADEIATAQDVVGLAISVAGGRGGGGSRGLGGNPFKGKTPQEIQAMFEAKGFEPRGQIH